MGITVHFVQTFVDFLQEKIYIVITLTYCFSYFYFNYYTNIQKKYKINKIIKIKIKNCV